MKICHEKNCHDALCKFVPYQVIAKRSCPVCWWLNIDLLSRSLNTTFLGVDLQAVTIQSLLQNRITFYVSALYTYYRKCGKRKFMGITPAKQVYVCDDGTRDLSAQSIKSFLIRHLIDRFNRTFKQVRQHYQDLKRFAKDRREKARRLSEH